MLGSGPAVDVVDVAVPSIIGILLIAAGAAVIYLAREVAEAVVRNWTKGENAEPSQGAVWYVRFVGTLPVLLGILVAMAPHLGW